MQQMSIIVMKKMLTVPCILMCMLSFMSTDLPAQDNPLEVFSNLMDGIWQVEGTWDNGEYFKQEIQYEWGLDKKMIKVKTYGTVNKETSEWGLRNEGIRVWDLSSKSIKFWEFDVFGGITTGTCTANGNSFHYNYEYQGMNIRDSWNYIDSDNYEFIVSSVKNGNVDKVFQKSSIKRITRNTSSE